MSEGFVGDAVGIRDLGAQPGPGVRVWITSLLFADDVGLLASSVGMRWRGSQLSVERQE